MRHIFCILALALMCGAAFAQDHSQSEKNRPVVLMAGLGNTHHPVTTKNPEAQKFFDQGLMLIYDFNHNEAARSFAHAAELDPTMAMAYWGLAEAVGPNYNDSANDVRFKQAHEAIEKGLALSTGASPSERDYIQALAKRFPAPGGDLHKAAEDYRDAMRELMKKYPDDLDAATLFAESAMNLHPWGLWHMDGTPEAGTEEIVATLESVIKRDPNHIGAVHYYIHAVEASPNPERALAGADRLAALAPSAGHIVHMPAHIYIRTGDYAAAVETNEKAAAADEAYMKSNGGDNAYSAMYYSHNLDFIAIAAGIDGDYTDAHKAAQALADHVTPLLKEMPMLEAFLTIPLAIDIRFHKWSEILALPEPDPSLTVTNPYWHYARGMALAGTGKVAEAESEYKIVEAAEQRTPAEERFPISVGNKSKDILKMEEHTLAAKIAEANKDVNGAILELRLAVVLEDKLLYNEPPDWFIPAREALGAMLLMNGDTMEAERIFREDLERNPRNPRSLFGLAETLKKEMQDYDAGFVEKEFQGAWKGGALRIEDLV